jgi:glutathione-regulated potassium-efflux system ancillary protein KefG
MGKLLDAADLIDAQGVAELLGLAQRNTVSSYQRRYPAMPRPVVDLGQGKCKLWLRSEIQHWRSKKSEPAGR